MIAGLTAAGGISVEAADGGEPLARPRLGLVDPVRLAVVITGDLVQRRRHNVHAPANGEAPAFVRERAQRGGAVAHRLPGAEARNGAVMTVVSR